MIHDRLVVAGARAITALLGRKARPVPLEMSAVVVHAVEPMIRTDEREGQSARTAQAVTVITDAKMFELRTRVSELPQYWTLDESRAEPLYIKTVRLRDVQALLVGEDT